MLCRPYYWPALHQKSTGYEMIWGDLSQTERLAKRFMTLPCGYFVSEDDVAQICDYLRSVSEHGATLAQRASEAT